MNREILFRGKRENNEEWVYGYYVGPVGVTDGHEICDVNDITGRRYDVDPSTIGQYTGLTDKNGARIFEGDIVRYIDPDTQEYDIGEKYVVGWDEGDVCTIFELFVYGKSLCYDLFNQKQAKNLETIGNIHDNPELLKEATNGKTNHS